MNTDTTYQGWANYETWCVHLWLTNEQSSDSYWRCIAAELGAEAAEQKPDYWTECEYSRFALADRLKADFDDHPLADDASVWADLLGAALSEVDWNEIADAFLEGTDE